VCHELPFVIEITTTLNVGSSEHSRNRKIGWPDLSRYWQSTLLTDVSVRTAKATFICDLLHELFLFVSFL
jgi:hypothetical protein